VNPTQPRPAVLKVGDTPHNWTVTAVLGHRRTHPVNLREYQHGYWWYEAKCGCGRKEILRQPQLASLRAKRHCNICEASRQRDTTPRERPSNALPPELDFARLKLK
jgi:hypothetical protein